MVGSPRARSPSSAVTAGRCAFAPPGAHSAVPGYSMVPQPPLPPGPFNKADYIPGYGYGAPPPYGYGAQNSDYAPGPNYGWGGYGSPLYGARAAGHMALNRGTVRARPGPGGYGQPY